MKVSFELKAQFPVSAATLYHAWLDSKIHSAMTGGKAVCSSKEGEPFSAWDGYIFGKNTKLTDGQEIVQSWFSSEFEEEDDPSELILRFEDVEGGCELTLIHTEIPAGQSDYEKGWEDHYFVPMRAYFNKVS
jgi:activator of HSP90 ATPase